MALADYLCREAIRMEMQSAERDEAIKELLEGLVEAGALSDELAPRALDAVLDRERLGSTAIGRAVAVPHAMLAELDRIIVAFGYSPGGVEFNALDGEPVHQIFLVLAPRNCADEYIGVMERITHLVQNEDFRRFSAQADSPDGLVELVQEMDV